MTYTNCFTNCNHYIAFCSQRELMDVHALESAILNAAERFCFPILRPHQLRAIISFLKGKDVFLNMPTGSAKSLCYALLPWAFDLLRKGKGSIAIVVSPLKALMKGQVLVCRLTDAC